ncbi:MAG: hypothetical protein NVS3B2_04660 [Ramlibacter sp.]
MTELLERHYFPAPIQRVIITAPHIGLGRKGRLIEPGHYVSLILLFATVQDPDPVARFCAHNSWKPLV